MHPVSMNCIDASTSNSILQHVQLQSQPEFYATTPASLNRSAWQKVERKKRVRSPEEITPILKQTKINDYWLNKPTQTNNRFDSLSEENTNDPVIQDNETSGPKPPPIFVSGVEDINPLIEVLNNIAKDNYIIKSLSNDEVKIQPKVSEKYTAIVAALMERKTDFHTYKPKQDRSFRVVLKNLHPSTDVTELSAEIQALGHEVTHIWNIKQNITKKSLPMFYVYLKPKENNKEIYNIRSLMYSSVKFEPPHVKRDIPQCMKCQRYGHTKNFCNKSPRCVKCTGSHLTENCARKERNQEVKCVNCNGDHPANYRGCIVHKQLLQRLYPALREKNIPPLPQRMPPTRQVQRELSFAQMVSGSTQQGEQSQPHLFTNTQQPNHSKISQQSDDMAELRTMMKQIMEQMGTMLSLLTTLVSKIS